jgi:hypothetical protein
MKTATAMSLVAMALLGALLIAACSGCASTSCVQHRTIYGLDGQVAEEQEVRIARRSWILHLFMRDGEVRVPSLWPSEVVLFRATETVHDQTKAAGDIAKGVVEGVK